MNNKDDILLAQAQKIETLREKRASRKNHKSKDTKRWMGSFKTLHYWSI